LRRALARNQFTLHYQPQVSIASGRIIGAEALLRWHDEEVGDIAPARFIPLAETTGLIVPIGEWVLHTACAQNKAWQDAGCAPIPVAVNLSPRQFRQANLLETITQALTDTGLNPNFLELEITESTIMHQAEKTIGILKKLHAMGVRLSVDDFGTGYSSLNYLKRFPVHKLKIDQSFVRDINLDPDDAAIVTAVIAMASGLNVLTIAEGVETEGQLAFLEALKCGEYQGYYFAKPMPADAFLALLRQNQSEPPAI
jgi:EAL domain-containing protein (putative c-di-GMP-specific phosphodiesterase class I)